MNESKRDGGQIEAAEPEREDEDGAAAGFGGAAPLSWAPAGSAQQAAAASIAASQRIRTCMTFSRRRCFATAPRLF